MGVLVGVVLAVLVGIVLGDVVGDVVVAPETADKCLLHGHCLMAAVFARLVMVQRISEHKCPHSQHRCDAAGSASDIAK